MIAHITTSMSISFDTPSLLYLEYSDEVASYYPKVNFPNLVEAVLDLNIQRNDDGLRNYEICVINCFFMCFESMPAFNNLKMLRISGSVHPVGWQAMPVFLQNCPHLETVQMEVPTCQKTLP
ncbi:BnaA08g30160D [Brassica napus]|uniref:BnaA08g30160D protein n=3 Tax=Brassica TaxID=3705 RepID=A0A078IUP8_BRANA|nr:BnaA08g30160D [Brassica napus]